MYDPVREVIFMKGAQVGATEAGLNIVGFMIDADPGPTMYVMPTGDTIKRNSKSRVAPMIDATPRLREKVAESRSRDSGNTMFQKDFPGGTLILAGANSAAGLRSSPIRTLILDEVDAFPLDLDGEGSPIALAEARTRTFRRRKIFKLSTPTIEGQSIIAAEFENTGMNFYHVPCPHCDHMQPLVWDQLKFERDGEKKVIPDSAKYECESCGELIEERFKPWMLARGEWIPSKPEQDVPHKKGYHLSSLYSPLGWYSWADAAQQFIDSHKNPEKLKVFTNTVLGETWKEKGEVPEWQMLLDRRSEYEINFVPKTVAVLTCGVDVQKDRIELEIVGWGKNKKSWSIDYRVLPGDTSSPDVWKELAKVLNENWEREDGAVIPISRMAIDTGYNTNMVYKFCRGKSAARVIPVKGQEKQATVISTPRPVDRTRSGKAAGSLMLYSVGVSILKQEIYGYLSQTRDEDGSFPDGFCFFPRNYDAHYFKMLTAEQLQKEKIKGYTRYVWVKIRERNEALDCFDGKTDVLTKSGWKRFADLSFTDELATVNLDGNVLEYQRPNELVARHHSGEMLRIDGKRLDVMVTPKHRMVVSRKKKIDGKWRFYLPSFVKLADEMDIHDRILTAPDVWVGDSSGTVTLPASHKKDSGAVIEPERVLLKTDVAEFLGWFVSEGGVSETEHKGSIRRRVEISQKKPEQIERIAICLEKLPWRFRVEENTNGSIKFVCSSKQLFDFVRECGHGTFEKRVPQWVKDSSPSVISLFLDSAIWGDGYISQKKKSHRPSRRYYTVSRQLADDIQELFLKIGKASNIYEVEEKEWEIRGQTGMSARQYHVSEIHHTKASLDGGGNGKREYLGKMIPFDGMVYCASVPNGTLVVRRGGKAFVSGNCRVYARAAASQMGIDRWTDAVFDKAMRLTTTSKRATASTTEKTAGKPKRRRKESIWGK